ncbi:MULTISPECIES: hypothetical protein [unclassified Agrococcus]|uniref:hypothetical protein n=1 Tax=unclassified Agrococcus TaxID=2615065 RepID=UPI00362170F7
MTFAVVALSGVAWVHEPGDGEHVLLDRRLGIRTGAHTGVVDVEIDRATGDVRLDGLEEWDDVVVAPAQLDEDASLASVAPGQQGNALAMTSRLHAVVIARAALHAPGDLAPNAVMERYLITTWPAAEPVDAHVVKASPRSSRSWDLPRDVEPRVFVGAMPQAVAAGAAASPGAPVRGARTDGPRSVEVLRSLLLRRVRSSALTDDERALTDASAEVSGLVDELAEASGVSADALERAKAERRERRRFRPSDER